jgi:hypothetical protein
MAKEWSPERAARVRAWSDHVAAHGVDVLVDAGLVARADFERARIIVAEELFVRLCLHDYPPVPELYRHAPGSESDVDLPRE